MTVLCTPDKKRPVRCWDLEAVQKRLDENPEAMRQSREAVGPPFGPIKLRHGKIRMGATHFPRPKMQNAR